MAGGYTHFNPTVRRPALSLSPLTFHLALSAMNYELSTLIIHINTPYLSLNHSVLL
jgi:hypothetical protein